MTGRGSVEAQDDAHGGRFAGAVGTEEAGDDAGLHVEGKVIDGERLAVAFADVPYFYHLPLLLQTDVKPGSTPDCALNKLGALQPVDLRLNLAQPASNIRGLLMVTTQIDERVRI